MFINNQSKDTKNFQKNLRKFNYHHSINHPSPFLSIIAPPPMSVEAVEGNKYHGAILSFWAGAATGLGGIFAVALMDWFKEKDRGVQGVLAFSLALAAGVMITVSVVDLWFPLIFKDGIFLPTLAVGFGMLIFKGISKLLNSSTICFQPQIHHSHHHHPLLPLTEREIEEKLALSPQQRNLKLAAMMFLALTLHNFPEGLAVSVSASASEELGLTMAIAVAFHNWPEGMAISVPYYAATNSKLRSISLAFISGLSEPLGALAAIFILGPFLRLHPTVVPYVLCVVAGIMISSSFSELIPEASSYGRSDLGILGFVCGTLTMLATIYVT